MSDTPERTEAEQLLDALIAAAVWADKRSKDTSGHGPFNELMCRSAEFAREGYRDIREQVVKLIIKAKEMPDGE